MQFTTEELIVAIRRAKALGAAAQLAERVVELYPQFAFELNAADDAFEELANNVLFWSSLPHSHDADSPASMRLLEFTNRFREAVHLLITEQKRPE